MFFVIISIGIYIFGIYLILVLSNCNAIQSTDCHVQYFNKLSIYLSISQTQLRPSPPPRATTGYLPVLSVPGVGSSPILGGPGVGHSPTLGPPPAFDTHVVSYPSITKHGGFY